MQRQTSMLVPSEVREQLAQSVQHREEPLVPEIAVHTFNSHEVAGDDEVAGEEWDAVQNRQLLV